MQSISDIKRGKIKMDEFNEKVKELIKKYNINIPKLEQEQTKLAKALKIRDEKDFDNITRIAGCSNAFFENKIISAIVVLDETLEIVEEKYSEEKINFPYIPGFRAYRELPSMLSCFNKLEERPDLIFIQGHGASHPRLGLASHFSLAAGIPSIGIAEDLLSGEIKDSKIYLNKKFSSEQIITKEGSRPIYVSPGNLISLETSVKLTKKFILAPHKLPEPLIKSRKYAKSIVNELNPAKH